ncbi:MAG: 1-acyl-sn-glycerol-3-phosphate acyltransferase [Chloroflexota bacterium]|nr:1-acyl-sn-glycerol-3-phosphate acyltransferase [Chloroflexota bacterium]
MTTPRSTDAPTIHPLRQLVRYALARLAASLAIRALFRVRVEGRDRLPAGAAVICFNHQSWVDPFVLMATLPWRPRLYFFGPKEADMSVGTRNRVMKWTGTAVPFRPEKRDLKGPTRRVGAILDAGGVLAIAGEGRIHAGEGELLALNDGAAFFALRSGVPMVPVAINGTSWLTFGRQMRVRIGAPLAVSGRPTREAVDDLTRRTWTALHDLVGGYPDPDPPPIGSFWFRLTEAFNEWEEGARPGDPPADDRPAADGPTRR